MKANTKILFISFLLFVCFKLVYGDVDNDTLKLFLTPTNFMVELIYQSESKYTTMSGYMHPSLNIVIDKSCSGFNFFLIAFLMITYLVNRVERLRKILVIPLAIIIAYLLTIIANVSRVLSYIILLRLDIPNYVDAENIWLHRAEGVLVYFSFLLLAYFILNYITTNYTNHEEITES